MHPPTPNELPSIAEIRRLTQEKLGHRPCLWQVRVVEGILKHDKDIIAVAATGSGKTLTFWMPLLFREEGIQILLTPINCLGKQNIDSLASLPEGIKGITVTAKNATKETFEDIKNLKYRVIVTNIEIFDKVGGYFDKLWKHEPFASKVISIIWDEAHCVSKWGEFRPEYKTAGRLRWIIPRHIPFYITSATLPPIVLQDVMSILHMSKDNAYIMQRSNDRSNVRICVREMLYPAKSYLDLAFLIPDKEPPGGWRNWKMPKFVIFFDNIADSIGAARFLRARLPPELHHMVKWFNANMSAEFRDVESLKLKEGDIWGLCCTDSFGMGVDLPDIELVIQWRASCDLCTLWQRFGRAARMQSMTGTALFLVESKYFDEAKAKKVKAAEKRKRKAAEKALGIPPSKRVCRARETQDRAPELAEQGDDSDDEDDDKDEDEDEEDEAERRAYEAGRRAAYEKIPVTERKRGIRPVEHIEPAMDDLINARTRVEVGCSRKPTRLYFRQDEQASDHILCDPRTPNNTGCLRCAIHPPSICCELCNPDDFANFARVNVNGRKRARNRARIPKYDAQPHDMELRHALHQFRKDETIKVFGLATLKNIGPSIILSNSLLDRIVDCAHVRKISTLDQLKHETQWSRADSCDAVILSLIKTHAPPVPLVAARAPPVLIQPSPTNGLLTPVKAIALKQCSSCKGMGHIRSNKSCPNYIPRHGKENMFPPPVPPTPGSSHTQITTPSSSRSAYNWDAPLPRSPTRTSATWASPSTPYQFNPRLLRDLPPLPSLNPALFYSNLHASTSTQPSS
ncbi:hypothetical protein HWV62_33295 [Athelia sp. TMB]|nr:hypothetical protein HWV62_33295 [Athelia sp. TMB]